MRANTSEPRPRKRHVNRRKAEIAAYRRQQERQRQVREVEGILRLAEIDQVENRMHREDRGEHMAINRALQSVEEVATAIPHYATEPAGETPVLAIG